jgi:hypothetical protein
MLKYGLTIMVIILLAIGGAYLVGYEPTNLELKHDENSLNKISSVLNQTGKTDPNAVVDINGKPAFVDKDGNFYGMIDIHNGMNIINITAKAPFKSPTSDIVTVKRTQDKYGVNYFIEYNKTIQQI